ncbi:MULTISPECIES: hypothetical protein [unclassified Guyparkeria]|uniref:hypothetical protein n=1 Tax=unclassified Guyparkeria TaxID=2626246 RepID=UPI0007338F6E|nr:MULTISPECIES: hypothetical protein [unclassified Guyparkeria]KTG16906.1 hypothetical protein AUR63_02310 [Guyparkeria sp. XI15]OAE85940.1 hypothetical protein AWR35_02310 [Guyparkeria sp. WRN-7]
MPSRIDSLAGADAPIRRLIRGARLSCLALAAFLPAIATADGWETTEWSVFCDSELIRTAPDEMCDDSEATGPAAATRAALEEASVWLEGLGFREPTIDTMGGNPPAYLAYISDEETASEDGFLTHGLYKTSEWTIYMNSESYFAVGEGDTEEAREANLAGDMSTTASMVHELFHAVQRTYQSDWVYDSVGHDWIFEGMAEAVAFSWLKRNEDQSVSTRVRSYEYPLHRPEAPDETLDDYRTFHFWFTLGEVLGSRDEVQYLDHLLEQDLQLSQGLEGIDAGLRRWHADGLYALYPTVMARYVMQDVFFDDVTEHTLTFPRDERVIGGQSVRPVATRAHRIEIDMPEGKTAGLEIRFADDDRPDLHLLVDKERRDIEIAGTPRNVHRDALHGPTTLFVRVANVAPEAADSVEQEYDLEVRLRPLDPCGMEAMESAAADTVGRVDNLPDPSGAVDDAQLSGVGKAFVERVQRQIRRPGGSVLPGEGRLLIKGLVSDGGVGCSGHLAATTVTGRSVDDREARRQFDDNLDDVQGKIDQLEGLMEKSADDMDQSDLRAAAALSAQVMEGMNKTEPDSAPQDVVLPVYSPNVSMWQAGQIRMSRHGGVGGWQSNAAANFVLHLPGTRPEDLREGQSYEAVAIAPESGGTGSTENPAVSPNGFYARWQGTFEKIPVPKGMAIRTMGYAFEGTRETLYGHLTGEVTIEELTGASIEATFRLSGDGTLVSTRYLYDCDEPENLRVARSPVCDPDEMLSGSLRASNGESRTTGPMVIEGRLRTPNRSAGGGVRPGYQNVVID